MTTGIAVDEAVNPFVGWLPGIQSIDTVDEPPRQRRIGVSLASSTASNDKEISSNDWAADATKILFRASMLPHNWDGEGSPAPSLCMVQTAQRLLEHLKDRVATEVPLPFVAPIPGGGLQIEWDVRTRHLEIEFLDANEVAWLAEDETPDGELTQSGECAASDVNRLLRLLEWVCEG